MSLVVRVASPPWLRHYYSYDCYHYYSYYYYCYYYYYYYYYYYDFVRSLRGPAINNWQIIPGSTSFLTDNNFWLTPAAH